MSPLNCSVFTALTYFLVVLTLQSSWEAPGGTVGALELSKHPKWGLGKFLTLLSLPSLPGKQVQHSAQTWECVCWGHAMATQRSLTVTLPFIPLGPHCPGQARQPAPAAQLAVLYWPRSSTIKQWWCASVCLYVQSEFLKWNGQLYAHKQISRCLHL